MKERPILFNDQIVRAVLDGSKTQTRRIVKPQPPESITAGAFNPTVVDRYGDEQPGAESFGAWTTDGEWAVRCPYGKPGDLLWVREAHAFSVVDPEGRSWHDNQENWDVIYRADLDQSSGGWLDNEGNEIPPPWRSSTNMPRWASRITLEITGVRVERLNSITDDDALAEGVDRTNTSISGYAAERFKKLWQVIKGQDSWIKNPWVWVIEFKRIA